MIDGLKLTMTGLALKEKLEDRIAAHRQVAADYVAELKDPLRKDPVMPDSVLEHEIEAAYNQIEVLTLIRDHVIADETYLLDEHDLRFADLLPEEDWMDCGCFPRSPALRDLTDAEPVSN